MKKTNTPYIERSFGVGSDFLTVQIWGTPHPNLYYFEKINFIGETYTPESIKPERLVFVSGALNSLCLPVIFVSEHPLYIPTETMIFEKEKATRVFTLAGKKKMKASDAVVERFEKAFWAEVKTRLSDPVWLKELHRDLLTLEINRRRKTLEYWELQLTLLEKMEGPRDGQVTSD